MTPPLREDRDRDAMLEGLADGSVDVIATDHAPHHHDEKHVEFDRAPFGIVGLETAVSLVFDQLVHRAVITPVRMVELMSVNPAAILGVRGGSLTEGEPADISLLAPDVEVTIEPARFRSRSRNTPFGGRTLRGAPAATIVGGRLVYVNDAVAGTAALAAAWSAAQEAR
jgi:dihydroorotase